MKKLTWAIVLFEIGFLVAIGIYYILFIAWFNSSSLAILEKKVKTVNLEELIKIFPEMLNGKTSGRILVDLNK